MATNAADPQGQEGHSLTRAGEDYLESIYRLSLESAEGDKSRPLRGRGRATRGLKGQREQGPLSAQGDGNGRSEPLRQGGSHRGGRGLCQGGLALPQALRTFLEHDLGVKPEVADEEACLMEHVLSADTMQRLIGYLERQGVEIPKD